MLRPKRAAASKARDCLKDALSGEDEEQAPLVVNDSTRRLSGRRQSRSADSDDDATWSQDPDSDAASRPAKKPRTSSSSSRAKRKPDGGTTRTQPATKRKKGKLSAFLNLPLDLVVEIAHQLDLSTLLSLSRVSKPMRRIFTSRSSAPIWSSARANVNLPKPAATDLSGAQLASLIYDRDCHICGRGKATIVDYALRIRWCKACQNDNLFTALQMHKSKLVPNPHKLAVGCSLQTYRVASGYKDLGEAYYCLPDVKRTSQRLHQLEAKLATPPSRTDELDPAVEPEEAAPERVPEVAASLEFASFIKHRIDLVAALEKDDITLVNWERSSALARQAEDVRAQEAREQAIMQNLYELGYTEDECDDLPDTDLKKLFAQPTALTPSIWTRIKPKLVDHLENERERVEQAREQERVRAAAQQERDLALERDTAQYLRDVLVLADEPDRSIDEVRPPEERTQYTCPRCADGSPGRRWVGLRYHYITMHS